MQHELEEKKFGLVNFVENHSSLFLKKNTRLVSLLAGIVVYMALYIVTMITSTSHPDNIELFGAKLSYTTVMSIVTQLQLLTAVCIVLIQKEKGYVIVWGLLLFSIFSSLISFLLHNNKEAIQGALIPLCTLFVIVIIYSYMKFSQNKYREALEQREEILALYEEITASESTLIEQRNQLQEYNAILEEREDELNQLAFYDPLTGLPNRRMIIDRLDALLQISKTEERRFSVVFVDLDNFKKINDSAGHQVGDEILQIISTRWKEIIYENDLLGRLGGDEFAIIIQRPLEMEEIQCYVDELRISLNERVYHCQREFFAKASFGVARYPEDGDTSELILKYADMAMYEAKAIKQNKICFFNQEMHQQFQRSVQVENYLQQILKRNELSLVYQPQYISNTHELRGFETLARWNNSKLGFISPKNFIPVAEETGMILPMGEFILREACITCKNWMDSYHTKFILSVNVSAVQLFDSSFTVMVQKVLSDTGFPPECLEVEVTESTFITSMESVVEVLNQLKEMGIQIALDDFGTGYASLSYLPMLPIDMIKVDKSFVDGIVAEKKQRALVKSLVEIAHELSMKVIAEGVEEVTQLEVLRSIKCDFIQGYLWGKPMEETKVKSEIFSKVNA
jgi:diguanylate cyclase (GGDEF)-like protein